MSDADQPESGDRPTLKLVLADLPMDDVRPILRDTLTDLGNAQRLVQRHGRDIHFVHHWKKWLTWDGIRWCVDSAGEIERRAKETGRQIYVEAANAQSGPERQALANHAKRSEAISRIRAMIEMAKSEAGIPVTPQQLDADPWLLNVENGTVDLRQGTLQPHRRDDLITKLAPVTYDPAARCPLFQAFLSRIIDGQDALILFLQRALGYSLTGDTSEQVMFVLHGTGANGKSTLINVILDLLGEYGQQTPADSLIIKRAGGASNDIARLKGARFVSAVEIESGRPLAEVLVKQLTGGDKMVARFLYSEFFEFRPNFKIFLATNNLPQIRGSDEGIWRRLRIMPFNVRIPENERDKNLLNTLRSELPGILAWAIQGCLAWQKEGLSPPKEVTEATSAYRAEMDVVRAFVDEMCVCKKGTEVQAKNLYNAFRRWCPDIDGVPPSQREFGMRLAMLGFQKRRIAGVIRWQGILPRTSLQTGDGPGRTGR